MNRKIVYWIATVVVCAIYLMGATFYITQTDTVRAALAHLGYPAYLIGVLIVAKLLAPAVLLLRPKVWLSDLVYAGILYHLLLAFSAHVNVQDYAGTAPALVGLAAMLVSFFNQNYARKTISPYAPQPATA